MGLGPSFAIFETLWGITQVLPSRLIWVHLAPITSPVRSPVSSVT